MLTVLNDINVNVIKYFSNFRIIIHLLHVALKNINEVSAIIGLITKLLLPGSYPDRLDLTLNKLTVT